MVTETSPRSARGALPGRRDHPSLLTVVHTELMRLRHGFLFWYAMLAPVVAAVPLYIGAANSAEAAQGRYWEVFRDVSLELWGVLVPITAGLMAALSVKADQDPWRLMLSYGVPRSRYFVGKFVALALLQLVSTSILAVLLAMGAGLQGALSSDLGTVLGGAYLPWLAGLGTLAVAVYVAMRWGLGAAITVGVAGMLCGALVSDKAFWAAVPMAWPMRTILPLAGIGPNGVPLPADSPLRDMSAIPLAIGLSLALVVVVVAAGGLYLRRKQL
ncbi:MAG TPA: ABC transporter permease [Pseudonocardiaceae bacterium]|nr:ABC transporter permease [Pseudonocardiaceae bacterium]